VYRELRKRGIAAQEAAPTASSSAPCEQARADHRSVQGLLRLARASRARDSWL